MRPANSKSLLMVRPSNSRGRVDNPPSAHILLILSHTLIGVSHQSSRKRHSMPLVVVPQLFLLFMYLGSCHAKKVSNGHVWIL